MYLIKLPQRAHTNLNIFVFIYIRIIISHLFMRHKLWLILDKFLWALRIVVEYCVRACVGSQVSEYECRIKRSKNVSEIDRGERGREQSNRLWFILTVATLKILFVIKHIFVFVVRQCRAWQKKGTTTKYPAYRTKSIMIIEYEQEDETIENVTFMCLLELKNLSRIWWYP